MPQIGRDREGDLPNSSIGLHLHSLLKYGTTYGAMRWGSVMARTIGRLKAVTVARAKTPGMLADGGGLYLRIGPTGGKSWIFRYRRDGKLRDMGIGALHTVTLAEARERALECRKLRVRGIDPIETRR